MTHTFHVPSRDRSHFITLEYRPELDDGVLRDTFLGDVGHIDHLIAEIQGRVCVDVGANIGSVTLKLLDVGAHIVFAVEPEDANLALLRRNLAPVEGRVSVIDAAVGNPNVTPNVRMVDTGGSAYSTTNGEGPEKRVLDFWSVMSVAKETAVHVAHEAGAERADDARVAYVSVDVEGAEYDWFATATPGMLREVDRWAIEFHGMKNGPNDLGPDDGRYGRLMSTLSHTHSVQAYGTAEDGGMIYAHGYWL